MRLCTDLGLKDAQEYANKLKKAEKAAKMREEVCLILLSIFILLCDFILIFVVFNVFKLVFCYI